jgi:hypothetical protein
MNFGARWLAVLPASLCAAPPVFFGHRFGVKRVIQTGVADVEES